MFRIHRNLLPSCNSYEGAVRVFEDAHQVASFGGWRGLKDRRDSSKLVLKMGDGSVKFRFHHTDLVTWMADKIGISTSCSRTSSCLLACTHAPYAAKCIYVTKA